jgi:hypothetical protein
MAFVNDAAENRRLVHDRVEAAAAAVAAEAFVFATPLVLMHLSRAAFLSTTGRKRPTCSPSARESRGWRHLIWQQSSHNPGVAGSNPAPATHEGPLAAIEAEEAKGPIPRWQHDRDRFAARIPEASHTTAALPLDEAVALALES